MFKTNFETQELRLLPYFEWGTKKSAGKESIEVDHYANTPKLFFFVRPPTKN